MSERLCYDTMDSPIGRLMLVGDGTALVGLHMADANGALRPPHPDWTHDPAALAPARRQIEEYFAGERTDFTVPIRLDGTAFERVVWERLRSIPYGQTMSYARLAEAIGKPRAARAVGLANSRNPVGIIVPCHRVIGANGKLVGYAAGVDRKRWLLEHERAHVPGEGAASASAPPATTATGAI